MWQFVDLRFAKAERGQEFADFAICADNNKKNYVPNSDHKFLVSKEKAWLK